MQENRSFDSYFGTYPGADGIPPGVCVPDPPGPCVRPFHDRHDQNAGGPARPEATRWPTSTAARWTGSWSSSSGASRAARSTFNPACGNATGKPDVMGYHDGADIPNYWAYARNYVLQDHMFESNDSWSLVAHLYLVSLWSARCSRTAIRQAASTPRTPSNPPDYQRQIGISDPTRARLRLDRPHLPAAQVRGELGATTCSPAASPTATTMRAMSCAPVSQQAKTPGIWNPLPYFDTVREDDQLGNIQSLSNFFTAAKAGTLPAVSWIVPNGRVSEHPPGLVSAGQTYVTGLINAIMRSPDWESTAIFLTWDDWGGFYDHVRPPHVDRNGYGIRVPGTRHQPVRAAGVHRPPDAELRRLRQVHRGRLPRRPAASIRPPTAVPIRARTCARTCRSSAT